MQISKFKTKSFILASAACLTLIFTLAKPLASQASDKDGKVHGDWKITCSKDEATKKTNCLAQQTISVKQDDKDVPVSTYQFVYNEQKQLKLVQLLPQGVLLQPGTNLIIGQKLMTPGKFTICQNNVCVSVAEVSNSDIQTITASNEAAVGFINSDGKQVNLKMSTKGLKEALANLK